MALHVHAIGIHPDGDVAFQQQALVVQGFDGLAQLLVAVVLQEKVDLRAIAVALGAILGIIREPVFVFFDKFLEISGFFQCVPLLLEGDLKTLPFGFQYFGIINGIFSVEHRSHSFESLVFLDAQFLKVKINRIQRKG